MRRKGARIESAAHKIETKCVSSPELRSKRLKGNWISAVLAIDRSIAEKGSDRMILRGGRLWIESSRQIANQKLNIEPRVLVNDLREVTDNRAADRKERDEKRYRSASPEKRKKTDSGEAADQETQNTLSKERG
jgi:hypothetical protein